MANELKIGEGWSVYNNMLYCAKFSRDIYKNWINFRLEMEKYGLIVGIFDRGGAQASLAFNDQAIFLIFRGTELNSLEDLKTDLKVRKRRGPLAGKVHRGFLASLGHIWETEKMSITFTGIQDSLEQLKESFRVRGKLVPKLYITGHSLGGALAILAAAYLREDGIPIHQVITFGCPRVGDNDFATAYNYSLKEKTLRITNNNDIVTRLIPRSLGYCHVGKYSYLLESGRITFDISLWERWLDSARGFLNDIGELGFDSIKDHSIQSYINQLEKNV